MTSTTSCLPIIIIMIILGGQALQALSLATRAWAMCALCFQKVELRILDFSLLNASAPLALIEAKLRILDFRSQTVVTASASRDPLG